MIVTLICIVLLVILVVATVITSIVEYELWEPGVFMSALCLVVLVICIGCACANNSVSTYKKEMAEYNEKVEELNGIKSAILNINDNASRLAATIEYNKMVKEFKKYVKDGQDAANDPWINWLVPKVYNDMDIDAVEYIEYE